MGQRLVITVRQDNKPLAAIYYHWSAYSVSAIKETRDVVKCIYDDSNPVKDMRLRLIRFVERNGGGIAASNDVNERAAIQSMYPGEVFKTDGIDRSYGLIALSEDGIADLQHWSEGDVTIELDSGMVYNDVCFYEDYNELVKEEWRNVKKLEDIPEYHSSFIGFSVTEVDQAVENVENAPYLFRDGSEIISLIA